MPRGARRSAKLSGHLPAENAVLLLLAMTRFHKQFLKRFAIAFLGLSVAFLPVLAQTADQLYQRATAAFDRGDISQSIALYHQALKLQPDSLAILTDMGVALARNGNYTEAIAAYQKATKIDPANPVVLLNLSLAWYKQGNFKQASIELERLRATRKDNQQSLYLLADCYLRMGKYSDVVSLLDPVYKNDPNDLAVDYALGVALIRLGQIHRGETVIDPIMKKGNTAEANLLLGEAQLAAQDFKAAAVSLQRAVQLNANLADAWSLYGRALLSDEREDEAVDAFQKALTLDPNEFFANLYLGSTYRHRALYPQALPYLELALRLRPASPEAQFQVAALHAATGKLDEARDEFEKLEREWPDFLEVHVQLASLYSKLNLKQDSLREQKIVLQLNEKSRNTDLRPKP